MHWSWPIGSRKILVALVCLLSNSVAFAQIPSGMPDFDVEKHCQQQSSMMGGGNFWLKACLDQEQEAYDELKREWPSLDAATIRGCRKQASFMGQSYFWLNACIQQEIEATEAVENFKFRK